MHVLGKVCAWLLVPFVIAGVILAGQAINVRNSWLQQADTLRTENTVRAREITEKEQKLSDLRYEHSLLERSWGRVWQNVNVVVSDPQQGIISAQLGTRTPGLRVPGQEDLPTLYGFYTPENGAAQYIGAFKVIDMLDNTSTLQLTKLPRASNVATWPQGPWRFWQFVPTQYSNRHDDLWNKLIDTDEHLNHVEELNRKAVAKNDQAKEQIAGRESELQGGPRIPMGTSGLVESLVAEEKARDEQLFAVDQLRRQIHGAQEKLQSLLEESRRLMEQLPKPYLDTAASSQPVKN